MFSRIKNVYKTLFIQRTYLESSFLAQFVHFLLVLSIKWTQFSWDLCLNNFVPKINGCLVKFTEKQGGKLFFNACFFLYLLAFCVLYTVWKPISISEKYKLIAISYHCYIIFPNVTSYLAMWFLTISYNGYIISPNVILFLI